MVQAIAFVWLQVASSAALYARAQDYTRRGVWDSALAVWRRLLLTERDSGALALVYQQVGYIALYRGDSSEALRLWRRALELHPDYVPALKNYQWLYSKLRRPPAVLTTPSSTYEPIPPLSERMPPHWGSLAPRLQQPILWLPAERLKE